MENSEISILFLILPGNQLNLIFYFINPEMLCSKGLGGGKRQGLGGGKRQKDGGWRRK
jgi:hypothetical protein